MSKPFTKEEVIQNKKGAIKSLNALLEHYINDPSPGAHLKKANLISYWLKEYVYLIDFEEKFDPTKNIAYKRGNVVKLNFGFNPGREYGGLHYGIVIDKHNDHNSPVLTVIPLTSQKEGKAVHKNSVELGNDLYRMLKIKYDTISKALQDEQQEIGTMLSFIQEAIHLAESNQALDSTDTSTYSKTAQELRIHVEEKQQHNAEQLTYLTRISNEISRMKEGSIALVNLITTVSKIRIDDPRNTAGVLSGISLSAENMDKVNEKLKELYFF